MVTEHDITEGTLIHGTLLIRDLLPVLYGELARLDAKRADAIHDPAVGIPGQDDPVWEDWDENERYHGLSVYYFHDIVAEVFDTLNEIAPEGFYFGSTEGDGSDFGWWRWEPADE
jgi:hypothetical protein